MAESLEERIGKIVRNHDPLGFFEMGFTDYSAEIGMLAGVSSVGEDKMYESVHYVFGGSSYNGGRRKPKYEAIARELCELRAQNTSSIQNSTPD